LKIIKKGTGCQYVGYFFFYYSEHLYWAAQKRRLGRGLDIAGLKVSAGAHGPSKFYRIFNDFVLERQYLKQNTVSRLKSNILTHPKFWAGHVTAHIKNLNSCFTGEDWASCGQKMNRQQTQNRR